MLFDLKYGERADACSPGVAPIVLEPSPRTG